MADKCATKLDSESINWLKKQPFKKEIQTQVKKNEKKELHFLHFQSVVIKFDEKWIELINSQQIREPDIDHESKPCKTR